MNRSLPDSFEVKLRISGAQHGQLREHLFPGDNNEAIAVALCGRAQNKSSRILTVHKIIPIPYEMCSVRVQNKLTWSTELLPDIINEAENKGLALLKIHSHPGGFSEFSKYDDRADEELFSGVAGWLDTDEPGASAIMLPDGKIFGRYATAVGFIPISLVSVAGDDLSFWHNTDIDDYLPDHMERTAQAFGKGTTRLLSRLSVAIVGCSGTGSPTIEMIARLGVGRLVLVDPDRVENRNLNRIYNATSKDAEQNRYKVEVLAEAVERMGLGTDVTALPQNLFAPSVVRQVADCDVVFGCVDSIDGRDLLNRISTFYSIPYFDAGVRLIADGHGGVNQVCGSVHYIQPGGSSLLSRSVYTLEQLAAAGLYRTDITEYNRRKHEGYISGVNEDRPAVISINTQIASLMVNEFLARIHPFRLDANDEYQAVTLSLSQMRLYYESHPAPCTILARWVGRGDTKPLLQNSEMSERR